MAPARAPDNLLHASLHILEGSHARSLSDYVYPSKALVRSVHYSASPGAAGIHEPGSRSSVKDYSIVFHIIRIEPAYYLVFGILSLIVAGLFAVYLIREMKLAEDTRSSYSSSSPTSYYRRVHSPDGFGGIEDEERRVGIGIGSYGRSSRNSVCEHYVLMEEEMEEDPRKVGEERVEVESGEEDRRRRGVERKPARHGLSTRWREFFSRRGVYPGRWKDVLSLERYLA